MNTIYLASASPRRIELVKQMGLNAYVRPADVDEHAQGSPEEVVAALAQRKAMHVAREIEEGLVLGADTLVSVDGKVLGKPAGEEEAFLMLKSLCGRWHTVYTGVCVVDGKTKRSIVAVENARVHMQSLSDQQIWSYIRSGEPMDKAGAYGIQGLGGVIVDRLDGDYYAVVGLPLSQTRRILEEMGMTVL